eukprot:GHVQ01027721.1.p2 GENE.GHVQ01027721.1~~GHVQ01027721.1.p2  ORF type:complete len:639 (+),score=78.82 GHVQ01027721.1:428-2344(+)
MMSLVSNMMGSARMNTRRQNDLLADIDQVLTIPRVKVKLVRSLMLECAYKVMDHFHYLSGQNATQALLEIEYFNEEGIGSGPTLEFYCEAIEQLVNLSDPGLFRYSACGGFLFPKAYKTDPSLVDPSLLQRPTVSPLTTPQPGVSSPSAHGPPSPALPSPPPSTPLPDSSAATAGSAEGAPASVGGSTLGTASDIRSSSQTTGPQSQHDALLNTLPGAADEGQSASNSTVGTTKNRSTSGTSCSSSTPNSNSSSSPINNCSSSTSSNSISSPSSSSSSSPSTNNSSSLNASASCGGACVRRSTGASSHAASSSSSGDSTATRSSSSSKRPKNVSGAIGSKAPRSSSTSRKHVTLESKLFRQFKFLGQLTAKALLDGRLVELSFHPLFWRLLSLGERSTIAGEADVLEVDPMVYRSILMLRGVRDSGSDVSALGLDFTLLGSNPVIELVEGGSDIAVDNNNLEEYIHRVCWYTLYEGIKLQVWAFRFGFATIMPLWGCQLFAGKEIAEKLAGGGASSGKFWTSEHLKSFIVPDHGYTNESTTFVNLVEALSEFTAAERRVFLRFCTGAPVLPSEGFGSLKPLMKVVKKDSQPGQKPDDILPSVMTCSNYLKLPDYSSKDVLKRRLQLAMTEGQGAFTLS